MALNIETWPDVMGLSSLRGAALFADELPGFADDFAIEDGGQDAAFLEFEDDLQLLEDRPGGLAIDGLRVSAPRDEAAPPPVLVAAAAVTSAAPAPGVKIKKRRRPRLRPPEKSMAEMAANAARFHAWQRGERQAPAFWDVTDQWVATGR